MIRSLAAVLTTAFLLVACSKNEPTAAPAPGQAQAPAAAEAGAKITQVIQTPMYTYAEVEVQPGTKGWIAGSRIDVKEGDRVEWGGASVMRNFHAASINRTFNEILFVSVWAKAGTAPVATAAHGILPAPSDVGGGALASGSGIAKSVAHGGGYSYVEVEASGQTLWVAAPQTAVKAGDTFKWQGGSEMRNFAAPSLGRQFDRLILATTASAGG